MPTSSPSIQEILERRRRETFVGRDEQLDCFREQLALAADDPRRRFVLGVSGQGGVGKTTLLRQYVRLAEAARAAVALSDDTEKDAPAVMARLAGQLGASGGDPFRAFNERYATYRRRRDELESQPDAPQGLAGLFARATVKGLARNTMLSAGLTRERLEDPLADQAGQWAEFVRRKLGNQDETQLVLEPAGVLSPLFVQGLADLAAGRRVALLLDTYDLTAPFLDGWLRELLNGRHGAVPGDVTFVAAGRAKLDHTAWAELEPLLARLSLDPFSDEVARDYLARRGITQEAIIAVILKLSGRLPLLLATLAAESPTDPAQMGDASGTAVERFLSWVDDPARRALALNAALPRRLNPNVVERLGGDAAGFEWLVANPFVVRRADGWAYHDVVRGQMLRYKRRLGPEEWVGVHEALAAHFEAVRHGLKLSWAEGAQNHAWRGATLEQLYHRLCAHPDRELAEAVNQFVTALDTRRTLAAAWAATLTAAGEDAGHESLAKWGRALGDGLQAYEGERFEAALSLFDRLLQWERLEVLNQPLVLARRGVTYELMGRYKDALGDFDRAIKLDPTLAWVIAHRGETYRRLKRYDEALADLDRAVALDSQDAWAIANRGQIYEALKRYDEALADLDRAVELNPQNAWVFATRGQIYEALKRYDEALANLNQAIELDPTLAWIVASRGQTYRLMERYDAALADFDRALELNPLDAWTMACRGLVHQGQKRYDEALTDFDRAVELDPTLPWVIARRGETYRLMGRYDAALADLNQAIELDSTLAWAIAGRGQTYRLLGHYDAALSDFNRALELDPESTWAIADRGQTYRLMGRYDAALADFDRVVELDPTLPWVIARRGEAHRLMGRYDAALVDLNHAIELDPTLTWAIADRGETYRLMERYDAALVDFDRAVELAPLDTWAVANRGRVHQAQGRYDAALADFNRAIEIDPTLNWVVTSRDETEQLLKRQGNTPADVDRAVPKPEEAGVGLWARLRARLAAADDAP